MKLSSSSRDNLQLSSREYTIIRAYLLGFRDTSLLQLLDCSKQDLVNYLHINDMFLMGLEKVDENFTYYPKNVLRKHLYRIQKLSTKYYEFRLANKQITPSLEAQEYIRINNFGTLKTGWQTYNPVKVKIDLIGNIELMNT